MFVYWFKENGDSFPEKKNQTEPRYCEVSNLKIIIQLILLISHLIKNKFIELAM